MVLLAACYLGQGCKVGHAPVSFVVLLGCSISLYTDSVPFHFSNKMVDYTEIPLKLQLREAHCHIKNHVGKGHKYPQFLSPMFLRRFPAIMDNQFLVDWDTITGAYDQVPLFPITLIDTEVLDYWYTHPAVWEVAHKLQHSRQVLAIVCRTLPEGNKGKPAVMFGVSLVYILAHQSRTNLSDALSYLKHAKGDCVVLVSMPIEPTYSPQPQGNRYFTLLPINGDSGMDRSPLSSFTVATLQVASREVQGKDMAVQIKLPPCFGSSKCTKYELIMETILSRGPLWHNTNYVEHKNNGEFIVSWNGQPLCQELEVSLCPPGRRLEYTSTVPRSWCCCLMMTPCVCPKQISLVARMELALERIQLT